MPRQSDAASGTMVELIGRAIAGADGTDSQADADRFGTSLSRPSSRSRSPWKP